MTPDPAMPKAMQVESLKRIFKGLNPEIGVDLIDWEAHVDAALTLPENRIELSIAYPSYRWFADEIEMKDVKKEALQELTDQLDYMITAVPGEAQPQFREVFEDYLSRVRYSIERKLTIAPLKKQIATLQKQLEQSKEKKGPLPKPPEPPKSPTWTTRLENKLRDVFSASLTREGLSPTKFLPEYRLELETIRGLPTEDEMVRAVEAFAGEIVTREQARKIRPPRLREERPPPERVYRPRPEFREEEEGWGVTTAEPLYPPRSMSEMPFPRRPASLEMALITDRFLYDLMVCGIYRPEIFLPDLKKNFEEVLFKSWDDMRRGYDLLVEQICKGIEARYPSELRALPYESIEEGVYWLVSQKRFESAEEIAAELHELGTPATAEEVRIFIRKGWEQKVPNFVIVTRDYLEKLLGEPLD